ncbi:glutaminase GtaA [Mollisia scopiformis]|uniref:Glutaminase GtaA n=1 Tax=Mollisia scopiformis TaxID=149040 RepID=A0A194XVV5_MOLSC|nr:glutaminase GtaA [Mollisia scopiformis]KUJ24358.1 glutaminase GtaA [Mollisia scopiformis]
MRISSQAVLAVCAALFDFTTAASTFSPARPPAIPIAVKSPYFNTLQFAGSDGGNGGYLYGQWTTFWAGQVTAWTGLIKVDNVTYTWMGDPTNDQTVTQTAFSYTSTRSVFIMDVGGKVEMNITFLSPLTPDDQKRQSLIFSYMDVAVQSMDGAPHDVQLYVDISAEWVAGDHSSVAQWEYGSTSDDIAYHRVWRQTQLEFSQTNDQADWGYWYFATSKSESLSFQSGADVDVRGAFIANGKLANTNDADYRPINQDWPVFGFSVGLGSVTGSVSTLYTLGLTQENAIQFDGATGIVPLTSLWTSYFSSETDALSFFYNDYSTASTTATTLDNKIASDASTQAGQNYTTIVSLSARQALGSTQLVGNLTKQYLFLKEISSDGNVQTVDVIFPFHPILIYLQPTLVKLMLDPLFENQESGQYPNKYSMHDLGSSYPNATGHPAGNDEQQPLEECGNMLIMTLAYAQKASDTAYLSQHYAILTQWTQYLIAEALIPANQISTDDFAGSLANQTNLALKGIIGIGAMAEIAKLTGNTADAANFSSIATSYITQWQTLGIAQDATPPHTTLAYGMNDTHGLLYNLYGDKLLNLGLVPQSVYDMQSAFYPTVNDEFGVPLDTRHNYTKSDWEMWAASLADEGTRDMFIDDLAKFINETPTNMGLTDLYDAQTADWPIDGPHFYSRPVVGGHFALLALMDPAS